jgi:osmotically-inducible protein OsmY
MMELAMSTDRDLQLAVLAELAWQPSVVAAHIGVTAESGVVTLSGHVDSFAQKHAAQIAASRVRGVKAVAEELTVRLAFDMKREDDDIALAAIERLSWDVSVPKDAIKVVAEQGWITLTGEVGWHYQKEAAEQDIRHLTGVVGLSNQITIKPPFSASDLGDDIQHTLHRSYFFDPKTVNVSAVDGRVRLTGSVRSWHDRQIAAETAWAAPGAIAVENDIVVI